MHVQNKIRIKFVSGTEKVIRRSMTRGYWEVVCFFAKCVSPKLERASRMAYGATKLLLNEDVAKGLFFHNGNTVSLYNRMDSREKRDFPCIWDPQYSWDKVSCVVFRVRFAESRPFGTHPQIPSMANPDSSHLLSSTRRFSWRA